MDNLNQKLKDAICNNDISFLEKNRNLYSIDHRFNDEDNDTLLLYSISYAESLVYKYLLQHKADIELVNDEGEGVLHAIVFSKDASRLKYFLNNY